MLKWFGRTLVVKLALEPTSRNWHCTQDRPMRLLYAGSLFAALKTAL